MEKYNYIGTHCKVECERFRTGYADVDKIMDDYLKALSMRFEQHIDRVLAMQQVMNGRPSDEEFLKGAFSILASADLNGIRAEVTTIAQYKKAIQGQL